MSDPLIVCGVDGSSCGMRAATVAGMLANEMGGAVLLVHVLPPRPSLPLTAIASGAQRVTRAAMRELDRRESGVALGAVAGLLDGVPHDRRLETGEPADRISAVALERDADLIVVGARSPGPSVSASFGSVSLALAARASRPFVIVPERDQQANTGWLAPGPIVCGVDGSDGAQRAVRVAIDLAQRLLTSLTLVTVARADVDPDAALAAPMAAAQTWPHGLEAVIRSGDPAAALAQVAGDRRSPLLVLGSHARTRGRTPLAGSVSAAVTRLACCPVVIAPPQSGGAETTRSTA
jgi:nucleotide-binding universal stress UspA family protein